MKKIGIIVAMEEEFEAIENTMKEIEIKRVYNLRFVFGKIEGKECVLVQSGVGKVNAARTTQVMIDYFELEYIINVGVSGSLSNDLKIGDILIGNKVVQHDFDITAFGHSKGYITGIGDSIQCSEELNGKLQEIIEEMPNADYKVKFGVIATGDLFCTDISMKNKIHTKFNADAVDMECAAIAQVAYLNEVPFIAVRSISDIPDGENASTFDKNLKLASERCANLLKKFLSKA